MNLFASSNPPSKYIAAITASTLSAKIGKPAIFIPFPFATENHQEYNAKVLEKVGAARIILDKDLNAQGLSNTIEEMLKDKNKLEQMGQNAKKVSVNYVEDKIYEEIEKIIK